MKIIEDSATRLVLKEGAAGSRVFGVLFGLIGIGLIVGGIVSAKLLIAVGAVFIVAGVLMALFSKSDVVTADKASRQLSVTFSSLKNKTGQTQACSFDDVGAVQLLQSVVQNFAGSPGNQQGGISFGTQGVGVGSTNTAIQMNLSVQLKTGSTITIANEQHQASVGLGVSQTGLAALGQKLAATLGVPFNQTGSQTLGQAVGSVVDAFRGTNSESVVPQQPLPTNVAPQAGSPTVEPSPPPPTSPPTDSTPSA